MKMTEDSIKAITPNGKLQRIPVDDRPGLYLQVGAKVGPTGEPKRTWLFRYRSPNSKKVVNWTIGEFVKGPNRMPIQDAKDLASGYRVLVKTGVDPKPVKVTPVPEPTPLPDQTPTVSQVVEDFYRLYVMTKCKPSTQAYQRWAIDRYVAPGLGQLKITDVTLQVVTRFLDEISLSAPVTANRVRSLLAKMFAWSLLRVEVMAGRTSPVVGSERNSESSRELRLTDGEIVAVGQRYRESKDPRRHAAIWPLLTGCRIGVVLNIDKGTLMPDAPVLTFPPDIPGLKGCRRVYLSPIALELLPLILHGLTTSQLRTTWQHLRGDETKKSIGKGCRCSEHDLRRTFASIGVDDPLNHDESVVDALLGHSRGKIKDTYIRRADSTLVTVAESIGQHIGVRLGIVEPPPTPKQRFSTGVAKKA